MTDSECHFGTLDNKSFLYCIKDANEKHLKNNILFFMNSPIFKKYDSLHFKHKLINFFIEERIKNNKKLFISNEEIEYVYFVKKGEVELSLRKNIREIYLLLRNLGAKITKDEENFLSKQFIILKMTRNFRQLLKRSICLR